MVKNVMTGTYIRNGEEVSTFEFDTDLSYAKKVKFVNSVVDILVNEDYNFIIRDLIFDYMIISIFTSVDISDVENSSSFLDDVEKLLEESNIVEVVKANAKAGLIEELNKAVDLGVEYQTGIHINPLNEALTSLVNTIERKASEVNLDEMAEIASKLNSISGDLTTDNIVKAYMNSDVHKKNLKEIKELKKEKNKK